MTYSDMFYKLLWFSLICMTFCDIHSFMCVAIMPYYWVKFRRSEVILYLLTLWYEMKLYDSHYKRNFSYFSEFYCFIFIISSGNTSCTSSQLHYFYYDDDVHSSVRQTWMHAVPHFIQILPLYSSFSGSNRVLHYKLVWNN